MSSSNSLASSLMLFFLLSSFAEAKYILIVGKTDSWKIPSSQFDLLNQWAEKNRFSIGDSLVWKFNAEKDSVLQVSREDYKNCNVSNPIKEYKTGTIRLCWIDQGLTSSSVELRGIVSKSRSWLWLCCQRSTIGSLGFPLSPMGTEAAVAPTSVAHGLRSGVMGALVVLLGMVLW